VKMSTKLFDKVSKDLVEEILRSIGQRKLAKSEIPRGWTGKVPLISLDLNKKVTPVIDRYVQVLMYFMLGDYAGKDAKEAALSLGFKSDLVPGGIFGVYLQAIDTQMDYYREIYGVDPPNMEKELLKASFGLIQTKTERIVNDSLSRYKNKLIDAIETSMSELNNSNLTNVQKEAHGLKEDKVRGAVNKAIVSEVEKKLSAGDLTKEFSDINKAYAKDWERNSETLMAMSSSAGTHQALVEVFGTNEASITAALVNIQDERCCDKCEEFARKPDGELRLYALEDFKPSGYNFSRKKADYELSISPLHHRCRCSIVYVPKGFGISKDGMIFPKKKAT
jgi:hypothetical protein